MINFLLGIGLMFLFEPFIINFVYMSNPGLFDDIILTKKSSEKLRRYYNNE